MGSISMESPGAAAWCRHMVLLVLLSAALIPAQMRAEPLNKVSARLGTADHVHATARRVGDTILVTLRIDPGYHINANPASNEYLIPTSIAFEGAAPERIGYPPATPLKPTFSEEPIQVYEGTVVISATFAPGALNQMRHVGYTLTVQACTEQICMPPDDISGRATW